MPPNRSPIFSRQPDIQWIGDITAANTNQDLTSGTSYLVFTADASNGGILRSIRIKANPGNNTAATVARVWINNGATTGTASNSALYAEVGIPATTASSTSPQADITYTFPEGFALPAGYRVYLTLGAAPGGSGEFTATAVGGAY